MILTTLSAFAGVVVGPAFTSDRSAGVAAVGLDLALTAEHDKGFRPVGRVFGGIEGGVQALGEAPATTTLELGGLVVVPSEDTAVIRLGVKARGTRLQRPLPLPLQTTRLTGNEQRRGLVPAVLAVVELEWTPERPIVVGLEAGLGSRGSSRPECLDLEVSPERLASCLIWPSGITASLYGRKTFRSGLTLSASAGTHVMGSIGWTFRHGPVRARASRRASPAR